MKIETKTKLLITFLNLLWTAAWGYALYIHNWSLFIGWLVSPAIVLFLVELKKAEKRRKSKIAELGNFLEELDRQLNDKV